MKKYIIVFLCILLVGCGSNNNKKIEKRDEDNYDLSEEQLAKYLKIDSEHKYTKKRFEEYIGDVKDVKISIYKDILHINYSYNTVSAYESYKMDNQQLYNYSIMTNDYDKNVEYLFSLMIFSNCNAMSFDSIDEILVNEEVTNKKVNNCYISKTIMDNYIIYEIYI